MATKGSFCGGSSYSNDKKVLLVISSHQYVENTDKTTGFSLFELAKAYCALKTNNIQPDIVSVKGGRCVPENMSMIMDDEDIKCCWDDPNFRDMIENSRSLNDVNPNQYLGVVFIGGMGSMFDFPYEPKISEICKTIYENGCVVAAGCHGAIALANVKLSDGRPLVQGKKVTGFTNEEEGQFDFIQYFPEHEKGLKTVEDIFKTLGANFSKGDPLTDYTICDGKLITAQNYLSIPSMTEQMVYQIDQCVAQK